jgi:hypothetical protein
VLVQLGIQLLVALEDGVDALDSGDADPGGRVDRIGVEMLDDVLGGELALGVGDDDLSNSSLVCLPRLERSTRNRIRLASACRMSR